MKNLPNTNLYTIGNGQDISNLPHSIDRIDYCSVYITIRLDVVCNGMGYSCVHKQETYSHTHSRLSPLAKSALKAGRQLECFNSSPFLMR